MSKETIKMREIRLMQKSIKMSLMAYEHTASVNRIAIGNFWDKEDDAESRKKLYKAHRGLTKARNSIKICQCQLRDLKRDLRKLNRQHDFRMRVLEENT